MEVELLNHTPLYISAVAIRTCWQSQGKSDTEEVNQCPVCNIDTFIEFLPQPIDKYKCHDCGTEFDYNYITVCGPNDKALINRVGNKFKHSSTLEHLSYSFYISDVSRALLQELARHRMASLSVKSTRYTLKELKEEEPFVSDDFDYKGWLTGKPDAIGSYQSKRASKYLVWTENNRIDISSVVALENLRIQLKSGIANDKAKYCLPEAYKTELIWTINARSLQNFLALRSSKQALWEIRDLANAIFEALPEDHKYLFEGCMSND